MSDCPFINSVKSLVTTGKCSDEGCPLSKMPPAGHLVAAGLLAAAVAILLTVLLSRGSKE